MWCGCAQGNSDGPLVPMVQLVPGENHVIPMVLLVNNYAEKGEFIHVMFNERVGVFYQGIKPRGEAE